MTFCGLTYVTAGMLNICKIVTGGFMLYVAAIFVLYVVGHRILDSHSNYLSDK